MFAGMLLSQAAYRSVGPTAPPTAPPATLTVVGPALGHRSDPLSAPSCAGGRSTRVPAPDRRPLGPRSRVRA
ncbi:hypothetical protein GCM10010512_04310 [Streptomyces thermoviolaceus subsp. thermoviolaceus]|nr:hypothetical protein GCM10010512_04310 [Streptomyces thermoviolaceus subsp. thermoviolaceus]